MKKRSIIFIIIAIILAIVGFSSTNTSKEIDAISKAVYVEGAKVLPENEGKVVIVSGKVEAVKPLVDELTGVEIPHIKAQRKVEIYERTLSTDDDGNTEYIYEWRAVGGYEKNNFEEYESSVLVADCKVGEFELDSQMLDGISTGKHFHDIEKTVPMSKGFFVEYFQNVTYVSMVDYMIAGGESANGMWNTSYYRNYVGLPRISYTIPYEDKDEYTFIGRQQNGKLVYDKDLGMQAATSGIMNPEQLTESVEKGGLVGAIIAWAIAAFFVLLAVLSMRKKKV